MTIRDYYRVLDVSPEATVAEVEAAYRRLVRVWHPDRRPDDPHAGARMRLLNEARAVLTDPVARSRFHALRELALSRRAASPTLRPNGRIAGLRPTGRPDPLLEIDDSPLDAPIAEPTGG